MRRLVLCLLGLGLVVASTSLFAGSGSAAVRPGAATVRLSSGQVVPRSPSARSATQEAAFRDEVSLLTARGFSTAHIARRLGLRVYGVGGASTHGAMRAAAAQARAAAARGAGSAAAARCPTPWGGTSPTAISLSTPRFLVSSGHPTTRYLYVSARWTFKDSPETYVGCRTKIGGRDGFGITLSRNVVNLGHSLSVCNVFGKCGSSGAVLDDNNARGAAYTYQDYADGIFDPEYTGAMTFSYRRLSGGCLQAFSKYAHSWATTAVTGIGVGAYSFDISWSTSSHRWTRASSAGHSGC